MRSTKIYVGNLPENARRRELQEMFEKYGKVKKCDIVKNYAFVHMSSEAEAISAIEAMNNVDILGSKISVEISHSNVCQRSCMDETRQCYRCGRQGYFSKEFPGNPATRIYNSNSIGKYGCDRFLRIGMEKHYDADLSFGELGFVDRIRPYPDVNKRRPLLSAPQQDNYMYYRRSHDSYGYSKLSPPNVPQIPSRYDPTQDPTSASSLLRTPLLPTPLCKIPLLRTPLSKSALLRLPVAESRWT